MFSVYPLLRASPDRRIKLRTNILPIIRFSWPVPTLFSRFDISNKFGHGLSDVSRLQALRGEIWVLFSGWRHHIGVGCIASISEILAVSIFKQKRNHPETGSTLAVNHHEVWNCRDEVAYCIIVLQIVIKWCGHVSAAVMRPSEDIYIYKKGQGKCRHMGSEEGFVIK